VDWSARTDLAGAAVEVLRGWAGAGGPVLSLLAVGAAASSALVGDERVRAVADDPTYARRVEVLRGELVGRLGLVLTAERDALAEEAGLLAFEGSDDAVRAAADALERVLS
jgi:hypothetical protein